MASAVSNKVQLSYVHLSILALVSQGEFSFNLLATNELGTKVMVKCTPKRTTLSKEEEERLTIEWEILRGNSDSFFLVEGFKAFQTNNFVCMVTEYCEALTVSEYVTVFQDEDSVDIDVARSILVQCLEALDHLHQRRIVHRDLTCEDVLISPQCKVKICGFGRAARFGSPRLQDRVGTSEYMALEAINSTEGKVSQQADLWSLGAIFFFLVHKHFAYEFNENVVVLEHNMRSIQYSQRLPKPVLEVFQKLLTVDLSERAASVTELRQLEWLSDWVAMLTFRRDLGLCVQEDYPLPEADHDIFEVAARRTCPSYYGLALQFPHITLNLASLQEFERLMIRSNVCFESADSHDGLTIKHGDKTDHCEDKVSPEATPMPHTVSSSRPTKTVEYRYEEVSVSEYQDEDAETTTTRTHKDHSYPTDELRSVVKTSKKHVGLTDKLLRRKHKDKYSVVGKYVEGAEALHYMMYKKGELREGRMCYVLKFYSSQRSLEEVEQEYRVLLAMRDVELAVQVQTGYSFDGGYGIITCLLSGWESLDLALERMQLAKEVEVSAVKHRETYWRHVVYQIVLLLYAMQERAVRHGNLHLGQLLFDAPTKSIKVCGFSHASLEHSCTPQLTDQLAVVEIIRALMGCDEHADLSAELNEVISVLRKGDLLSIPKINRLAYFQKCEAVEITRTLPQSKCFPKDQLKLRKLKDAELTDTS